MKKTYIRFFEDKNNEIPNDSEEIDLESSIGAEWMKEQTKDWLKKFPSGKVDFVNL